MRARLQHEARLDAREVAAVEAAPARLDLRHPAPPRGGLHVGDPRRVVVVASRDHDPRLDLERLVEPLELRHPLEPDLLAGLGLEREGRADEHPVERASALVRHVLQRRLEEELPHAEPAGARHEGGSGGRLADARARHEPERRAEVVADLLERAEASHRSFGYSTCRRTRSPPAGRLVVGAQHARARGSGSCRRGSVEVAKRASTPDEACFAGAGRVAVGDDRADPRLAEDVAAHPRGQQVLPGETAEVVERPASATSRKPML